MAFASRSLTTVEASQLVSFFAQTSQAGMPLSPALRALAEESGRSRLSRALVELAERLDRGESLADALSQLSVRVPEHVQALIAIGVETGDLPGVLGQLIELQRLATDVRRRVRVIVAYPLLLVSVLIGWLVFCAMYIMPQYQDLADGFGFIVPEFLNFQYTIGKSLVHAALLAVVVLALVWIALRLIGGKYAVDLILRAAPLFGRLWQYQNTAEFCQLMSLFLQRQVPLPKSLGWTASAMRDHVLASSTRRLAIQSERGSSLSAGVASSRAFPEVLAPILAWGERTRSVDQAMAAAAEIFRDRVELQIGLIRFLIPPMVFIGVALIIVVVVSATISPLVHMITWLGM